MIKLTMINKELLKFYIYTMATLALFRPYFVHFQILPCCRLPLYVSLATPFTTEAELKYEVYAVIVAICCTGGSTNREDKGHKKIGLQSDLDI